MEDVTITRKEGAIIEHALEVRDFMGRETCWVKADGEVGIAPDITLEEAKDALYLLLKLVSPSAIRG